MTFDRKLWPWLSLAVNVGLIAALVVEYRHPPERCSDPYVHAWQRSTSAPRRNEAAMSPTRETNDTAAYISALRAAGAAERLIEKVVVADFDEHWQSQIDDLQARYAKGEVDGNTLAALTRRRPAELEQELKSALGEEGFRRWDTEQVVNALHLAAGSLTPTEQNAVYRLRLELRRQLRDLEAARDRSEITDEQFNGQFASSQQEYDDQLKALLGAERTQQMRAPSGDSDPELQRALRKINANDLQFETVVEVQKSWLAQRSEIERQLVQGDPQKSPALEDRLRALDAARDQENRRVLGSEAFENMQKEQDPRYATMQRYADAWHLDPKGADDIFRSVLYYEKVVQDYRQQARALENGGQTVDWNAVNQNLLQFSQQTAAGLKNSVGEDLFEKLKANHVLPFDGRT